MNDLAKDYNKQSIVAWAPHKPLDNLLTSK